MMEITNTFKLSEYTLLDAITLLDNYYMKSQKKFSDDDVHLCGMCCLFIASKEQDEVPLTLQAVYDSIGHKSFKREVIIDKELDILKTLGFECVPVTALQIAEAIMA